MGLTTITQPPFRVTLKSELLTYLTSFTDGSLIFCDEDSQWYCKRNGIIITAESGFYGEISMTNNATQTTLLNILNYAKIAGVTIAGASQNFNVSGNNKIICTATVSKTYVVDSTISAQNPNGNNQVMFLALFKNNVLIPSSEKYFSNTSTNQIQSVSTGCVISLVNNDYVECFIKNSTGLNNILVKSLSLKVN